MSGPFDAPIHSSFLFSNGVVLSDNLLSGTAIDHLVPDTGLTRETVTATYPPRSLSSGAEVTRFPPSPTGYVHIGGILVTAISKSLADASSGVFILRVEDTDRQRIVEGAEDQLFRAWTTELEPGASVCSLCPRATT